MKSGEIRQAYLDFFQRKDHQVVASSSLVPANDPTLLFTNAGMVQFKDVFLGTDQRPYARATSAQKCMRVAGKHNDLEDVGPSPRHHTFFEMLGNFSFGDYFKAEAIRLAWELLTEVYGLPPDRLAVTVYEKDDESYDLWQEIAGVPVSRIGRLGPKDNFWQMADIGPRGPNTEIHWDRHPERGEDDILPSLQADDGRFLEIWNLVFMQFNRTQPDEAHTGEFDVPLEKPGVDTGMGFERMAAVLQGASSNYGTDLFTDVMDATQDILGQDDTTRQQYEIPYRVIADHMRAATFLIADGVTPGTNDREYVVRMLIRRAMRFAYTELGRRQPFLHQVAEAVIAKMGPAYPELTQFDTAITRTIRGEEDLFLQTIDNSLDVLEGMVGDMAPGEQMSGSAAFVLYSTHGLPLEITRDLLKTRDLSVDEEAFTEAMEQHRQISDAGKDRKLADVSVYADVRKRLADVLPEEGVTYDPYDNLDAQTTVLALLVDGEPVERVAYQEGQTVEIVLGATPFYVEAGGQVSDTGILAGDDWEVTVTDVWRPVGGLVVHVGELTYGDVIEVGSTARAVVNNHRRQDIMRNHTATHLLHASLREVLGPHVRQRGSLVAPDRLRFDFSHDQKVTDEELDRIVEHVNEIILSNEAVRITFKPLDEARREGAMALFGEKYGEIVRTVTVGDPLTGDERWSYELCGGTHVTTTGEIGTFIVTAETASGAGVRRIEAVTGHAAQERIRRERSMLLEVARQLGARGPEEAPERASALLQQLREAEKQIEAMQRDSAKSGLEALLANATHVNGMTVVTGQVDVADADLLGEMADWCRDRIDSGAVVLGAVIDGAPRFVVKVTKDAIDKGLHAGKTAGAVAKVAGGGGGGRPDFATGGGGSADKIDEALTQAPTLIAEALG